MCRIVALSIALCFVAGVATSDDCMAQARAAADLASWRALQQNFAEGCAGVVHSELRAEAVVKMLLHHWSELPALQSLSHDDPAFLRRVVDLVGDSTPEKESLAILQAAATDCPAGAHDVCRELLARLAPG